MWPGECRASEWQRHETSGHVFMHLQSADRMIVLGPTRDPKHRMSWVPRNVYANNWSHDPRVVIMTCIASMLGPLEEACPCELAGHSCALNVWLHWNWHQFVYHGYICFSGKVKWCRNRPLLCRMLDISMLIHRNCTSDMPCAIVCHCKRCLLQNYEVP